MVPDQELKTDKSFVGKFYPIKSSKGVIGKVLMIIKLWKISNLEENGNDDDQRTNLKKKF